MNERRAPKKEANRITRVLNEVLGQDRFPLEVKSVAKEISRQWYPDDPVTLVRGGNLGSFDGGLYRAPAGRRGWGIIYNESVASEGRINFTLAHEFGHYLLHRVDYPNGIQCTQRDVLGGGIDELLRKIESEANDFAATLLMPFDDFRRQIDADSKPGLEDIGGCADRYGTSLTAATLRWLEYTKRRAVLVVSRDGFMMWSRSSGRALRTGKFFRTAKHPPVPIHSSSLANAQGLAASRRCAHHEAGVWFDEPCEEVTLRSDRYDFAISLLHLDNAVGMDDVVEDPVETDAYEGMIRKTPGSSWLA